MNFRVWFSGLRSKMLFIALIPAVLSGIVCFYSLGRLSEFVEVFHRQTNQISLNHNDGVVGAQNKDVSINLWKSLNSDKTMRQKLFEDTKQAFQVLHTTLTKSYEGLPQSEKTKTMVRSMVSLLPPIEDNVNQVIALLQKGTLEDDLQAKKILFQSFDKNMENLNLTLSELKLSRIAIAQTRKMEGESLAENSSNAFKYGILTASLVSLVLGLLLASRIAKDLAGITISLSEAGEQMSLTSQKLSTTGQKLSSSTTKNAAAIQETASSLEEFSSMVKQNADNAREANQLSQTAQQTAEAGENEAQQLMTSIGSIVNSSKKIEEIISVIDGIAFQTNLLALNAAVEAARAGEHGKGFAVVAEAVRNLAHRSAGAAKEISTLIKDNVEKSDQGSKVALKSSAALKDIVTNVKKVSDLISEIASASQEQSQGIEQIAKAINQVDQTTQSNAATSEESAAASGELSDQAVLLGDMVVHLVTIVEGKAA